MRGLEQVPWIYDAMCAICEATGLRRWRGWLAGGARGRTLDLGCGTGRNLPLFPAEARIVGIDLSADSLRRARKRDPRARLVRASAEALPFRDGTFDTVVGGLVLCSVGRLDIVIAEIRRVLRDDGELRLLEHVRSTRPWKARLQDFVQPAWTALSGGCHPNRDTEAAVLGEGFAVSERRARNDMRRMALRRSGSGTPAAQRT
jgi:ubiquinone/menaquinone biosynthesis C-methylase UbiE